MKELILTKPEVIDKLKKGSKWIAGFCCLAVLCNLAEGWITFSNAPPHEPIAIHLVFLK